jgi:hypothetical protein
VAIAGAAQQPSPRLGLEAFLDGKARHQKRGDEIQPPPAEHGVASQTQEDGAGEVCAKQVPGALAVGGGEAERVRQTLLGARSTTRGGRSEG